MIWSTWSLANGIAFFNTLALCILHSRHMVSMIRKLTAHSLAIFTSSASCFSYHRYPASGSSPELQNPYAPGTRLSERRHGLWYVIWLILVSERPARCGRSRRAKSISSRFAVASQSGKFHLQRSPSFPALFPQRLLDHTFKECKISRLGQVLAARRPAPPGVILWAQREDHLRHDLEQVQVLHDPLGVEHAGDVSHSASRAICREDSRGKLCDELTTDPMSYHRSGALKNTW